MSYQEQVLCAFSNHPGDVFTIRNAAEGTHIMGGIGSGKSSGSGQLIAKSFLNADMGGLILCAKSEEAQTWLAYAKQAGRLEDVILFDQSGSYTFNFLRYEMKRPGRGAGYTENVVRLFTNIAEAIQGGKMGQGENAYWMMAMQQLLRNAVDLLYTARGEISVPLLQEVIQSAPNSVEETFTEHWQQSSLVNQLIHETLAKEEEIKANPEGEWLWLDFSAAATYFMQEYPLMGDRQRSSIVSQWTTLADMFMRRPFRQLFCSKTTVIPDMTRAGKLIILDVPVKEFGSAGRAAQIMFKFMWQQAVERDQANTNDLPAVFLWADEAQNFISEYDAQFQATARSSRACTVYITQNLPNYYASMGGESAKARVDALVGNFGTKIWHANSDPTTNEQAAQVIGKSWQTIQGSNQSASAESMSFGSSSSKVFEYEVTPQHFTRLAKGGPPYNWTVEGIVFQNGRTWQASGKTYLKSAFLNK